MISAGTLVGGFLIIDALQGIEMLVNKKHKNNTHLFFIQTSKKNHCTSNKFLLSPLLLGIFWVGILLFMRRWPQIFFFILFVAMSLSLPSAAKRLTLGFHLAKMRLVLPHHPEWEISPNPDVFSILKQKFHFLGKGAQCYAFESEDKQFVLKLFRYNQPMQRDKVTQLFNGCKIAYDLLRDETGLLFIHLNPTPMDLPIVHFKDPIGRHFQLDMNGARFAIQKKAQPFRLTLEKAKASPEEMKNRIDEFLALLEARTAKGVFNSDPNLSRNFGFLENRAIEFDFGNYRAVANLDRKEEIKRYTSRLRRWLKKYAPEWVAYLDERIGSMR